MGAPVQRRAWRRFTKVSVTLVLPARCSAAALLQTRRPNPAQLLGSANQKTARRNTGEAASKRVRKNPVSDGKITFSSYSSNFHTCLVSKLIILFLPLEPKRNLEPGTGKASPRRASVDRGAGERVCVWEPGTPGFKFQPSLCVPGQVRGLFSAFHLRVGGASSGTQSTGTREEFNQEDCRSITR